MADNATDVLKEIQPPTELREKLETQAGMGDTPATLPEGTKVTPVLQTAQDEEFVPAAEKLGVVETTADQATTEGLTVTAPEAPVSVPKVEATTVSGKVGEAEAVQGTLSDQAIISDVPQGTVSRESLAKAEQGTVSEKATVQYQIGELMSSIEQGKPLPAWASGAARGATAVMQQRGLGASSMASAAMVQALMEAGLPIAAADAQTYAAMDMQNLNNRQQATLANAATFAAMDRANLDARMTAAVNNAKAFLTIDLQNLDNRQKTETLNFQAELEAMFKDQAAENAADIFNAKNEIQVEQFFAELDVQVQNANANRVAAMDQFNVSESNAMKQFSQSLNDSRQRFNTQMKTQIDQANAVWRRDINTANTAIQNETNRLNAQNLLGLTTTAQNQLWQKYRDEAAWIFQMSENAQQRAHQVGMLAMENDYNNENYEKQFELESVRELGKTAIEIIYGYTRPTSNTESA